MFTYKICILLSLTKDMIMFTATKSKIIQEVLVLMILMVLAAHVSTYPPIIRAKPEQIHISYGCKYYLQVCCYV